MQNNTASRNVQDRVFTSSKVISKFDQRVFSHNSKQKKQTDAFYEVMGQSQRLRNDIVKNELSGGGFKPRNFLLDFDSPPKFVIDRNFEFLITDISLFNVLPIRT